MPLTMSKAGETVTIRKITGRDDCRQRLAEMGFVVGTHLTVISNTGGNLIVCVKSCRVALNESMALRIIV